MTSRSLSSLRPRVGVPWADDPDSLGCIARALRRRLADFVLLGDPRRIRAAARAVGTDLSGAEFVAVAGDEAAACAHAADLAATGRIDVLMKGRVMTSSLMRAVLDKARGLVPPGRLLSHVAVFTVPRYPRPLLVTDAALNIQPDLTEKAGILANAVELARRLGIRRPRVACIGPVEKVNAKIPSTVDAAELCALAAAGRFGDVVVEGPLSLDAAVSRRAARIKGVPSAIAGAVDILLLPDLDAANVLYKSLTQFCRARCASVVMGVRVPVVLTSRADDEATKLASLALAVRLAQPLGSTRSTRLASRSATGIRRSASS